MLALEPAEFMDRYPSELSGGQAQRVGVARALAADPPVLLMDEPFGAVDPVNREVIQDEFLRMQKSLRKTVLFVSHDIDEAVKMADYIAIFRAGKLEQFAPPDEMLARPANAFVAGFVGQRPHAEAPAPHPRRRGDGAPAKRRRPSGAPAVRATDDLRARRVALPRARRGRRSLCVDEAGRAVGRVTREAVAARLGH